jgi:hypothetical protein
VDFDDGGSRGLGCEFVTGAYVTRGLIFVMKASVVAVSEN